MAKGSDGKTARPDDETDEETTRRVQRKSIRDRIAAGDNPAEAETHIAGGPGEAGGGDDEEDSTGPMGRGGGYVDDPPEQAEPETKAKAKTKGGGGAAGPAPDDDGKTQIYRPKRAETPKQGGDRKTSADKPEKPEMTEDTSVADPVVGWVVVTEGPGRGASFPLGYGNNRIGRAESETVSLDFGDTQISRENHATLTYDGKNRRFFVKEGDGRNLIYVGDDPVLVPVELKGDEELTLGETKLRFVPFCGKDFDWHNK